jgi:hypothetical protein
MRDLQKILPHTFFKNMEKAMGRDCNPLPLIVYWGWWWEMLYDFTGYGGNREGYRD